MHEKGAPRAVAVDGEDGEAGLAHLGRERALLPVPPAAGVLRGRTSRSESRDLLVIVAGPPSQRASIGCASAVPGSISAEAGSRC